MDDITRGHVRLVLAMLTSAVRQARRGNPEASNWIRGPEAAWWADLADIAPWPPRE